MVYQITVPGPKEGADSFAVLEWHKDLGDTFGAGDLLVEIETQKSVIEVRTEGAGVVRRILCPAGEWRKPGQPLALVSDTALEPLPDDVAPNTPALSLEFDFS